MLTVLVFDDASVVIATGDLALDNAIIFSVTTVDVTIVPAITSVSDAVAIIAVVADVVAVDVAGVDDARDDAVDIDAKIDVASAAGRLRLHRQQ